MRTCGSLAETKRPETALKLFIRFALAKGVVTYGLELMMALFRIVQGVISTIMSSAGFGDRKPMPQPPSRSISLQSRACDPSPPSPAGRPHAEALGVHAFDERGDGSPTPPPALGVFFT